MSLCTHNQYSLRWVAHTLDLFRPESEMIVSLLSLWVALLVRMEIFEQATVHIEDCLVVGLIPLELLFENVRCLSLTSYSIVIHLFITVVGTICQHLCNSVGSSHVALELLLLLLLDCSLGAEESMGNQGDQ